jgi:patatin-like phospholipase/acyl hydrolase
LNYIEEGLQRKADDDNVFLSDYFDMIAGTSTGGILTCFYLLPESLPAKEAIGIYAMFGKMIFKKRKFNPLGLFSEKYTHKGLDDILLKTMGDVKLSDVKKRCLITAYDMEQRKSVLFTVPPSSPLHASPHASPPAPLQRRGEKERGEKEREEKDIRDYYLRDVARATSAAPTYFEPAEIRSMGDAVSHLIDGGIYANNPSLCAWIEAYKSDFGFCKYPVADDLYIVSVGTGKEKKKYKYDDAKDWGVVSWARPILDILLSASAEVVNYQMKQLFSIKGCTGKYSRLEPELGNASSEMDDASDINIKHLKEAGSAYILAHVDRLNEIIDFLYENRQNN